MDQVERSIHSHHKTKKTAWCVFSRTCCHCFKASAHVKYQKGRIL